MVSLVPTSSCASIPTAVEHLQVRQMGSDAVVVLKFLNPQAAKVPRIKKKNQMLNYS